MSEFDDNRVRVQVQDKPQVRLSVIDAGPRRAGPVLFFVQGAGGHALQWVNQLRYFSQRTRCIAPDLRGHGESDKPRDGYTVDAITDDLVAVLDRLEIREPVVLGHATIGSTSYGLLGFTAVGSALGAMVGAWLMTDKLKREHVKLVIGVVLLGIAAKMVWGLLA